MRLPLRLLIFSTIILLTANQCRKKTEEPQLPPETTTGAMTFGCKINGKVFVPRDGRGKLGLYCQYVYMGTGTERGWHLNIPATNWKPNPPEGINIETDSLLLVEGVTYNFQNAKGFPQIFYSNSNIYAKLDTDSGSLHITKHDQINRVLSGTFFFNGTNTSISNGGKVSVTEGRFDIRY